MSRKQSLLALGIWLMVLPFLGFRSEWKTFFLLATGAGAIITYFYRRNYAKECTCHVEHEKKHSEVFVDNRNSVISQS